ncbi:MAG TPA: zeta toxin family protein [Pirellulaceae bacterium]|nr:zeta toxin family protein [Pirellulaceae bacterium]
MVGGPNGAGKTTFVRQFQTQREFPYLGADEIAYELSPDDPYAVRLEAGRLFIERFYDYVARPESFIVESTLSGRTFRHEVQAAKAAGYRVEMVFCFLDSAETAVHRVETRIAMGGHFVPPTDIRRRYSRSLRNFWELYRPLADVFLLVYNALETRVPVAQGQPEDFVTLDEPLLRLFLSSFAEES